MAARAGALAAQRAKRKKSRTKSSRTMSKSYNNNNIDIRKKELTVEYKNKLKKYHEESKSNSVYNFQIPIVYHMLKLQLWPLIHSHLCYHNSSNITSAWYDHHHLYSQ